MKQYKKLLQDVLSNGAYRESRTGVSTYSVFGRTLRFDLTDGFPVVTIKRVSLKSVFAELLWFLKGSTNARELNAMGATIWDEWAIPMAITQKQTLSNYQRAMELANKEGLSIQDAVNKLGGMGSDDKGHAYLDEIGIPREKEVTIVKEGELGAIYGAQWRGWATSQNQRIDQIKQLIQNLIDRPYSRRHIVSAWNVEDLPNESESPHQNVINGRMALAPCHYAFQMYVRDMNLEQRLVYHNKMNDEKLMRPDLTEERACEEFTAKLDELKVPTRCLDCLVNQRSVDVPLGLPFNIASYAMLTAIIANEVGMGVGDLIFSLGDAHIYANQLEAVKEMLQRECKPLPELRLAFKEEYSVDDLVAAVIGYDPHPAIAIPIAV